MRIFQLSLVTSSLLIAGCATSEETVHTEAKREPAPLPVSPQPVPSAPQPSQPQPPAPPEQRPVSPPAAATEVVHAGEEIAPSLPVSEAPAQAAVDQSISILGTIQYVELEGGFFGIVTEEGARYFPQYLPFDFKVDGLPVRVDAMLEEQVIGIQMWGVPIRILSIRPG